MPKIHTVPGQKSSITRSQWKTYHRFSKLIALLSSDLSSYHVFKFILKQLSKQGNFTWNIVQVKPTHMKYLISECLCTVDKVKMALESEQIQD